MPGKTPLVGWLKGYMVPELMGIQVEFKRLTYKKAVIYCF